MRKTILLGCLLLIGLVACNGQTITEGATLSGDTSAQVIAITDGDTIKVNIGGVEYNVRYIGVNTPEIAHSTNETGEPCGQEATEANRRLVEGQTARLVRDVSETDRYGRLLRYVYVGDTFVNAELVRQGWAEVVSYPPDTREFANFRALEQAAAQANLGCHPTGIFDDGSYER